jgi:hypothetical protein
MFWTNKILEQIVVKTNCHARQVIPPPNNKEMDPKLWMWEDGDVDIEGLLEEDVVNIAPLEEEVFCVPQKLEIGSHA